MSMRLLRRVRCGPACATLEWASLPIQCHLSSICSSALTPWQCGPDRYGHWSGAGAFDIGFPSWHCVGGKRRGRPGSEFTVRLKLET